MKAARRKKVPGNTSKVNTSHQKYWNAEDSEATQSAASKNLTVAIKNIF